ncbi:hypothetical protein [Streptomyces rimosus]|nr:hypothetical protein [Streptomyces rimosus]
MRSLSMGGSYTDGNVQVLCAGCHGLTNEGWRKRSA